jgi:integrase
MPKKKKVLRVEWPRVYWTPKRGRLVLCVDSRKTGFAAGKREFWATEAEALASAEQIARIKETEGALSFLELTPAQRRDAAEALALLDGSASLLDAARTHVRETERLKGLAHVPTVSEAINAYLTAKRAEEAKGEITRLTLYEIESKMRIVRAELGTFKVIDIDEAAVSAFLRRLHHAARGKANIRTKLSQFLNYCRREGKWITANPTENIKVRVKNGEVKIFSVDEVKGLLSACQKVKGGQAVAPFILVQLFAGLRPFEAMRLKWERIHFETGQIEVVGATSKTGETRFVTMTPTLTEWLLAHRKESGSIIGADFPPTLKKVKQKARLLPWVKDALRHTYDSYWLPVHKNRAELAEQMGTSLDMIKRHYRRAIPESVR